MLNQNGNSTRALLITEIKNQLNDPNGEMWSAADLQRYLQRAVTTWYNKMIRLNSELANRYEDFTFAASTSRMDMTSTLANGIRKVIMLEDRTNQQPGPCWVAAEDVRDLYRYSLNVVDSVLYGNNPKFVFYFEQAGTLAAAQTLKPYLEVSPQLTSARSMRIHYQCEAPSMSVDAATSALPPEAEEAVVLQACILAKFQEDESVPQAWQAALDVAERHLRETVRPIMRGPKRIRYLDD